MIIRRNCDAQGIALFRQLAPIGKNLQVEFLADPLRGFALHVENADHFGIRALRVQSGMVAAERAYSDDSDLQLAVNFHVEKDP